MSLNIISSSGSGLDLHDSRELGLPFVTVFDQLLFVVEKLFVQERCVLKVGPFDDCVNGASFLAEAAENALGHVDIVFCGAAGAIGAGQAASQSLQAMQRSSPVGYLLRACSPRNIGERGPFSQG